MPILDAELFVNPRNARVHVSLQLCSLFGMNSPATNNLAGNGISPPKSGMSGVVVWNGHAYSAFSPRTALDYMHMHTCFCTSCKIPVHNLSLFCRPPG
jgi:hypothetical protein